MFFLLSKLFAFLLQPLIWIMISVVLFIFLKDKKWKKAMAYTSIGLFLFFSNSLILQGFIYLWEVQGKQEASIEHHDIGIVLSGMMEYNPDFDRLTVRRGTDRLWQAVTLYKQGKLDKILISGDNGYVLSNGLHEADQLKDVLVLWGIPSEDIIVESKSRNTHENAQYTAELLQEKFPESSLLLITSAMHMRRAAACFEKEGLHFDTYSTDHYYVSKGNFSPESLLPNVEALQMWRNLNKEWVGFIAYALAGYL